MNIHQTTKDKVELAAIYAEDGAFRTAARLLQEAADTMSAHADYCDNLLNEIAGGET